MQHEFVETLDRIRGRCEFPFVVTSGFRTSRHNGEVGGVDGSAHTSGFAADIACRTSRQRQLVVYNALLEGIQRIGVAKSFVHLDCHPFLPKPVLWLYD